MDDEENGFDSGFFGTDRRRLDEKSRLILPKEHRSVFEGGAVLTKMVGGCLALWRTDQFTTILRDTTRRRVDADQLMDARSFAAGAAKVRVDRQGRITVPDELAEYARIPRESEVVLTGFGDSLEIWSAEIWDQHRAESDERLRHGEGAATLYIGAGL